MSRRSRSKPSPQAPQPSPSHVLNPRAPRQTALLAILVMLMAVLLFNAASYSLAAMAARLGTTSSTSSNSPKYLSGALADQDQDWQIVFLSAPATTKLCFAANVFVGATSCLVLMHAFFWWMTNASLVSGAVRNYALAYGLGAGIAGIVFVHIILVPRLNKGDGFLMAVNSILGSVLAGLAFGTME